MFKINLPFSICHSLRLKNVSIAGALQDSFTLTSCHVFSYAYLPLSSPTLEGYSDYRYQSFPS